MSSAGGGGDFFGAAGDGGAAAVDAVRAQFDAAKAEAEGAQLPLIPPGGAAIAVPDLAEDDAYVSLPDAAEIVQLQIANGGDLHKAIREHRRRKGLGGRKPGAKNRQNLDFQRYLLQFGPMPGVTQMRFLARSTEQLAAELGCSKHEAAQLQIRCDDNLMPYFARKQPVDVNVSHQGDITIQFGDGGEWIDGGDLLADAAGAGDDNMLAGFSFADAPEMADFRACDDGDKGRSE